MGSEMCIRDRHEPHLRALPVLAGRHDDVLADLADEVEAAAAEAGVVRARPPAAVVADPDQDRVAGPVHDLDVHQADGPVPVRVLDGVRRGLDLIREVGEDVVVATGEDGQGTEVRFVFPAQPAVAPSTPGVLSRQAAAPITPTTLRTAPSGTTVAVIGDLDLAGVQAVRAALLERIRAGAATVDLRGTAYLASAGVALLAEADRVARGAGRRLRLVARAGGAVRRMLELAGIDRVVEVSSRPR